MNARYWNGNTASKIDEFAWGALAAAQRLQSRSSSFAARVISAKTPLAPCGYCAAAERLRRVRHLHIAMMGEIKVEPSRGQQSRRFSEGQPPLSTRPKAALLRRRQAIDPMLFSHEHESTSRCRKAELLVGRGALARLACCVPLTKLKDCTPHPFDCPAATFAFFSMSLLFSHNLDLASKTSSR